jgi:hypothetical protein
MIKEKKKMFDTNNTFYKLLKFLSETKTKGYEICNIVDDDGDSIHAAADIEELEKDEGQVFISTDTVEKFISLIDKQQQRLGSSINNNKNDD